jgi:transposase-like protein
MDERIIRRYSDCFKQQVVSDLESGRFASIEEARSHYGLGGKTTIQKWLRRYGKNHLQAKVVRVEKPEEADQIRQFRQQVARLEQALGKTQAENLLHAEYLKLACEALGTDLESFKKKVAGKLSGLPGRERP